MVSCILMHDQYDKIYCHLLLMKDNARKDVELYDYLVDSLRHPIGEDRFSYFSGF